MLRVSALIFFQLPAVDLQNINALLLGILLDVASGKRVLPQTDTVDQLLDRLHIILLVLDTNGHADRRCPKLNDCQGK